MSRKVRSSFAASLRSRIPKKGKPRSGRRGESRFRRKRGKLFFLEQGSLSFFSTSPFPLVNFKENVRGKKKMEFFSSLLLLFHLIFFCQGGKEQIRGIEFNSPFSHSPGSSVSLSLVGLSLLFFLLPLSSLRGLSLSLSFQRGLQPFQIVLLSLLFTNSPGGKKREGREEKEMR